MEGSAAAAARVVGWLGGREGAGKGGKPLELLLSQHGGWPVQAVVLVALMLEVVVVMIRAGLGPCGNPFPPSLLPPYT